MDLELQQAIDLAEKIEVENYSKEAQIKCLNRAISSLIDSELALIDDDVRCAYNCLLKADRRLKASL